MSEVHVLSLKKGASHGLWQYKIVGAHERVMMEGVRRILDATCQALRYGDSDRSVVYLFCFSAEPFEGWQVALEKMREAMGGDCYYRVGSSNIGGIRAKGRFPATIRGTYLRTWPERIYFSLETSLTGGIVS